MTVVTTYVLKGTGMSEKYVQRCYELGVKYTKFITEWKYMPSEHWWRLKDVPKHIRYFTCWRYYNWGLLEESLINFIENFNPEIDDPSIDLNVEDPVGHMWWWKPSYPPPPTWDERNHRRVAVARMWEACSGAYQSLRGTQFTAAPWGLPKISRNHPHYLGGWTPEGVNNTCIHPAAYMKASVDWDWFDETIAKTFPLAKTVRLWVRNRFGDYPHEPINPGFITEMARRVNQYQLEHLEQDIGITLYCDTRHLVEKGILEPMSDLEIDREIFEACRRLTLGL